MDKILVHGGATLQGSVRISGSKNSALPILAAALLTKEQCIIHHVPDLSDINYMLQILNQLGAEVERASGTVTIKAENIKTHAPYDIVRKMRASVCVLGPLLGREQEATVALPGGCVIGDRPIDLHLKGFECLGAKVRMNGGDVKVFASELHGAVINLRGKHGSTVLGTDNVMMAAVLAEGTTVIEGAARRAGGRRSGELPQRHGREDRGRGHPAHHRRGRKGTPRRGTRGHSRPHRGRDVPRRRGDLRQRRDVEKRHPRTSGLRDRTAHLAAGFHIESTPKTVTVRQNGGAKSLELVTEPYPGFPTDMQAQMCALLATTEGISTVTENIFPQRFMHLSEMKRMGADIRIEGQTAIIQGVDKLSAAPVMASDLRASAALVLAGLKAEGVTEINRVYHIDRGYEHIDDKLSELGATIERVVAGGLACRVMGR